MLGHELELELSVSSPSASSYLHPSSSKDSKDIIGSFGSDLSTASTDHSSNSSPIVDKISMSSGVPRFRKDLHFKEPARETKTDLKALMEAEEEMQAIWLQKPKSCTIKPVVKPSIIVN